MSARGDFWSRRRAGVEAEAESLRATEAAEAEAERSATMAGRPDAEILEELGLPDPDTLGSGDDIAAFMARHVPAHLRRRALRALWTSNPVFANLDGLVDYAEDYTDAARAVPDLRTSYRVGKGLLRHVERMAEAQIAVDEGEAGLPEMETEMASAPPAAPVASPGPDGTEPSDPASATRAEPAATDRPGTAATAGDDPDAPAPRRMTFRFAEARG